MLYSVYLITNKNKQNAFQQRKERTQDVNRERENMFLEELRNKAKETLSKGWLSTVRVGDRSVCCYSDGFHCESWDRFDPEFTTLDIDEAINYLYPEP